MGYVVKDIYSKQPYGFLIRLYNASKILFNGLKYALTVNLGLFVIDCGKFTYKNFPLS
jgi:hypothetical protein